METIKKLKLELLSENALHQPSITGMLSYCPSMDLVALGTNDNQVQIYRLNGQEVYRSSHKNSDLKVQSLAWKPNGQLLAIAWSDGSVRLVGAESTKVVHQFHTEDTSNVTCIGWAANLTRKVGEVSTTKQKNQTWDQLLGGNIIEQDKDDILNLPRDLSQIDIETSLPKLSTLASGGTTEDVFSSRASLDALFRAFDTKDTRAVDVMVVGTRAGNLHLSIYDSFIIGSLESPVNIGGKPGYLVFHASNKQYSTHSLLLRSPEADNTLFFLPMDLRFVSTSSDYLSLLASRSSALQNLLRYIHEVHRLMVAEFESTRDLPSKFLRNVDEDLKEKDNREIVQALYHSVATGHTFPTVKEWLVDELAERGHKRWDKAVTSGLQNLKQLVHENMLPALDRCSVILSRFAGIAKFRGSSDTIGFTIQQISLLNDNVACLHLVSSKILIRVVEELELFTAFSAWLRHEIDRLASENSTTADDDAADKESAIDHSKVLEYIQTAMQTSPLASYLGKTSEADIQAGMKNVELGLPMFETLTKNIQKMELGQQYEAYIPLQGILTKAFSKQASKVFAQIADAEKRNILFGDILEIGKFSASSSVDMKVDQLDATTCQTFIAIAEKDQPGYLQVVRISLSIEKGISKLAAFESSSVQLGDLTIKDVKIFGESLLILYSSKGETGIISIPHKFPPAGHSFKMHYSAHALNDSSTSSRSNTQILTNEQVQQYFQHYEGVDSKTFNKAESIELRQETGTGSKESTARIVLIGQNKARYKILKLVQNGVKEETGSKEDDVEMSQDA